MSYLKNITDDSTYLPISLSSTLITNRETNRGGTLFSNHCYMANSHVYMKPPFIPYLNELKHSSFSLDMLNNKDRNAYLPWASMLKQNLEWEFYYPKFVRIRKYFNFFERKANVYSYYYDHIIERVDTETQFYNNSIFNILEPGGRKLLWHRGKVSYSLYNDRLIYNYKEFCCENTYEDTHPRKIGDGISLPMTEPIVGNGYLDCFSKNLINKTRFNQGYHYNIPPYKVNDSRACIIIDYQLLLIISYY